MNNIPIFLSSDDNYAPFAAVTIASICDNTKEFCEFYILDGGISDENKQKIELLKEKFDNFSVEFIKIDIEKYFKNYPNSLHYTKTMYARFLIPDLKPELERVIYSDVDVVVLDDIKNMYDESLDDYVIGAVPESFICQSVKQHYLDKYGIPKNHIPFASGNLVIDCKKWREQNITPKLLSVKCVDDYVDQTIMNIYFAENYKKLDKKYCYTIQHDVCFNDKNGVVICHFNGPVKPWQINENNKTNLMPFLDEFWHYAKMTPFYEELKEKTLDSKKQQDLLMKLRVFRIQAKSRFYGK